MMCVCEEGKGLQGLHSEDFSTDGTASFFACQREQELLETLHSFPRPPPVERRSLTHTASTPSAPTFHRKERLSSQGDMGRMRGRSRCRRQDFLVALLASPAGVPLLQARGRGQRCRDCQQRARQEGEREDQDGGEAGTWVFRSEEED